MSKLGMASIWPCFENQAAGVLSDGLQLIYDTKKDGVHHVMTRRLQELTHFIIADVKSPTCG